MWKFDESKQSVSFVDEKTISVFSLMKIGFNSLKDIVMIPPHEKLEGDVKYPLHIATAGTDTFYLIIISLDKEGKLGYVYKT